MSVALRTLLSYGFSMRYLFEGGCPDGPRVLVAGLDPARRLIGILWKKKCNVLMAQTTIQTLQ
jgi:hypothetical protein